MTLNEHWYGVGMAETALYRCCMHEQRPGFAESILQGSHNNLKVIFALFYTNLSG
jgi:hypothetical protein